jgi:hypothetical protein
MHPVEGGLIGNSGSLWMLVTPDVGANIRVPFAEECGKHPGDDYYIVAYKVEDDGWNIEASGTLNSTGVPEAPEVGGPGELPIDPFHCC